MFQSHMVMTNNLYRVLNRTEKALGCWVGDSLSFLINTSGQIKQLKNQLVLAKSKQNETRTQNFFGIFFFAESQHSKIQVNVG